MKSCLFWVKEKKSKKYVQCFDIVIKENMPLFLVYDFSIELFVYQSSADFEPAVETTSEACQKGFD